MRSGTPKLLHDLCGRPMIAWSVAAAREAGAERVIIVENPRRELEAVLGDSVEFAIQEEPRGTADAVRAAARQIEGAGTVIVLNGDHPLITAATIRGLTETHERSGAAATNGERRLISPTERGALRQPTFWSEGCASCALPGGIPNNRNRS